MLYLLLTNCTAILGCTCNKRARGYRTRLGRHIQAHLRGKVQRYMFHRRGIRWPRTSPCCIESPRCKRNMGKSCGKIATRSAKQALIKAFSSLHPTVWQLTSESSKRSQYVAGRRHHISASSWSNISLSSRTGIPSSSSSLC